MADVVSREKRSKIMGLVKSKNTKPEVELRKQLHSLGFRFSLHNRNLPGTPDIKLTKYKTVIFVNGCFWHGHSGCKHYTVPQNNNEFWVNKIATNISRDERNYNALISLGWRVIVVWTCDLKKSRLDASINQIADMILNQAHKNSLSVI